MVTVTPNTCADPECFVRGGPALSMFFFSLMGKDLSKYHYEWAIFGPPAKRHLNGISQACRLWPKIENWLGSFTILGGSGPVLLKKPYIFDIIVSIRHIIQNITICKHEDLSN